MRVLDRMRIDSVPEPDVSDDIEDVPIEDDLKPLTNAQLDAEAAQGLTST